MHKGSWSLEGVNGLREGAKLDLRQLGLGSPVSMRVRVGRNLTSFPLPGAMTKADRIKFENTMLGMDVLRTSAPAMLSSFQPHPIRRVFGAYRTFRLRRFGL